MNHMNSTDYEIANFQFVLNCAHFIQQLVHNIDFHRKVKHCFAKHFEPIFLLALLLSSKQFIKWFPIPIRLNSFLVQSISKYNWFQSNWFQRNFEIIPLSKCVTCFSVKSVLKHYRFLKVRAVLWYFWKLPSCQTRCSDLNYVPNVFMNTISPNLTQCLQYHIVCTLFS